MTPLTVGSLGEYIREQREQAQVSLRQLSRLAGVSNPYLSQVERGLKKPSAEILQQIAKGLRISVESLYERAGLLDGRSGVLTPTVAAAVLADHGLTSRQKRALLDVYDAFRRENGSLEPTAPAAAEAEEPGTTAGAAATSHPAASRKGA